METNENAGKLISNAIWKFGERILGQGISFLISIILARLLTPSDYGVVSLVLIFITFADVFITNGFSTALIQKKDADEVDFSTIFYCSFGVAVLFYLVLFIAAPYIARYFNEPILIKILRVFSLRLPISAFNSVQHAYVSRHMQFRKFFFSTLTGVVFSGTIGIMMAYQGFGIWALVVQYLLKTGIDSAVLYFTVHWRPKFLFSIRAAGNLMNYGWKVLLADFSGTFFTQLRSMIIGKYYSTADLAYYERGKNFPDFAGTNVCTALMSVLFPELSNHSTNINEVKNLLRKSIRVTSYVVFPMMIGLAAVAESLVLTLLTSTWKQSIPFVRILCISTLIGMMSDISMQSIKAIGRSDILLRLEIVKKPIYMFLLFVGIRKSVLGVAITMLIYSIYGTLVNTYPLKKLINYSYREQFEDLVSALMMSLIMGSVVILCELLHIHYVYMLCLQVTVGVLLYVLLSFVFKPYAFVLLKGMILNRISINGRE